jgi:hypothetical protein
VHGGVQLFGGAVVPVDVQLGGQRAAGPGGVNKYPVSTPVKPESRPRPVPAVPVAAGDLRRYRQALTDVGHAGVRLADTALQLPVEVLVVEEQLHGSAP